MFSDQCLKNACFFFGFEEVPIPQNMCIYNFISIIWYHKKSDGYKQASTIPQKKTQRIPNFEMQLGNLLWLNDLSFSPPGFAWRDKGRGKMDPPYRMSSLPFCCGISRHIIIWPAVKSRWFQFSIQGWQAFSQIGSSPRKGLNRITNNWNHHHMDLCIDPYIQYHSNWLKTQNPFFSNCLTKNLEVFYVVVRKQTQLTPRNDSCWVEGGIP